MGLCLVHNINTLTKINVKIDKCELPTFYWLPKLHKRPYKSRFISNSIHCSTTILSTHITSALTAVKDHVMKYSETAFSNSNVNYFWSIKSPSDAMEKCDCVTFRVLKYLLSTFLRYTRHCHMILSKQKCYLWSTGVSTENQNLTSVLHSRQDFSNKKYDSYRCWSCAELCEAFTFLMENIYVQFDGMVYQQIVGIPMGTNCALLIADLFLTRLHFSAEELLLYPRRPRRRPYRRPPPRPHAKC